MGCINRRLALSLVWLPLIVALPILAQAQRTGSFEGQVVNGTAGGPAVGVGLPVTLHIVRGGSEVDSVETTTDVEGGFRFEGLELDASLEYWAEAVYLDVTYSSDEPLKFGGEGTNLTSTITVYETTDGDSAVRLDSVHLIAESFGKVLRISEIHLFGNSGDRTYVGRAGEEHQPTTVYIPLPENGVGLAFEQTESADRFVEVEGGVMDTDPVPPGRETSLAFFSYHLLVTGETIRLERRFAYPVSNLSVLVAQPGLMLRSEQLEARGQESFQGRQYELSVTQALATDEPLVMELNPVEVMTGAEEETAISPGDQPLTTDTPTRGKQELLRTLGFVFAGLLVVGAIVYPMVSRHATPAPVSAPDLAANPKAPELLLELAGLEEAFEAGRVDEARYEQQRARIYEALKSSPP